MSKSEEFLDLIENHHYKGYFHDNAEQNFCLLGAANKVYGMKTYGNFKDVWTHDEKMNKIIKELFPELEHLQSSVIPYFNDHYGSKEDIMLVAKHFANKIDTIKE